MDELQGRVRIKDIAEQAGVSVGTVDRVLHGRPNVSEKSRKKVEEVLKQIDYQPNMYASALASNKRYKFFCMLPQHKPGEYWSEIEQGINRAQRAYNDFNITVNLFYYDPFNPESFKASSREMLKNGTPDGVIISPSMKEATSELTEKLDEMDIPFVFIDSNIPELHPLAFCAQHPTQSGYFAARILYMVDPTSEIGIFRQAEDGVIGSNQQRDREAGFKKYMHKHHPKAIIHTLELPSKRFGRQFDKMDEFFQAHPNMHSGICFNSKVFGIGEYLEKRNIKHFHLMGYEHLDRNNECLKNGFVEFLIAQHPWKQGYDCTKILIDYLILKKDISRQNFVPIELLTAENMDFYSRTY
ncbi:MAG: LacI family DNA-binding transcriptional regulator [Bacteroidaceae bacterium]|nr:LacI family DNA-binding transcriptional regulator [Bacteroidaceae bacterium]